MAGEVVAASEHLASEPAPCISALRSAGLGVLDVPHLSSGPMEPCGGEGPPSRASERRAGSYALPFPAGASPPVSPSGENPGRAVSASDRDGPLADSQPFPAREAGVELTQPDWEPKLNGEVLASACATSISGVPSTENMACVGNAAGVSDVVKVESSPNISGGDGAQAARECLPLGARVLEVIDTEAHRDVESTSVLQVVIEHSLSDACIVDGRTVEPNPDAAGEDRVHVAEECLLLEHVVDVIAVEANPYFESTSVSQAVVEHSSSGACIVDDTSLEPVPEVAREDHVHAAAECLPHGARALDASDVEPNPDDQSPNVVQAIVGNLPSVPRSLNVADAGPSPRIAGEYRAQAADECCPFGAPVSDVTCMESIPDMERKSAVQAVIEHFEGKGVAQSAMEHSVSGACARDGRDSEPSIGVAKKENRCQAADGLGFSGQCARDDADAESSLDVAGSKAIELVPSGVIDRESVAFVLKGTEMQACSTDSDTVGSKAPETIVLVSHELLPPTEDLTCSEVFEQPSNHNDGVAMHLNGVDSSKVSECPDAGGCREVELFASSNIVVEPEDMLGVTQVVTATGQSLMEPHADDSSMQAAPEDDVEGHGGENGDVANVPPTAPSAMSQADGGKAKVEHPQPADAEEVSEMKSCTLSFGAASSPMAETGIAEVYAPPSRVQAGVGSDEVPQVCDVQPSLRDTSGPSHLRVLTDGDESWLFAKGHCANSSVCRDAGAQIGATLGGTEGGVAEEIVGAAVFAMEDTPAFKDEMESDASGGSEGIAQGCLLGISRGEDGDPERARQESSIAARVEGANACQIPRLNLELLQQQELAAEEEACQDSQHCQQQGSQQSVQKDVQERSSSSAALQPGMRVLLSGLTSIAHLNGALGTLESLDHSTGRWHVRLSGGEVKALKPANLHPEVDCPETAIPVKESAEVADDHNEAISPDSRRQSRQPPKSPGSSHTDLADVAERRDSQETVPTVGNVSELLEFQGVVTSFKRLRTESRLRRWFVLGLASGSCLCMAATIAMALSS